MVKHSDAPRATCPRCRSTAVTRLHVVEHEVCGAVKPRTEFRTGEGFDCPDCDVSCEDADLVTCGTVSTCADCGQNFSRRPDSLARGDGGGRPDGDAVLERVREAIATATPASPGRIRWGNRLLVGLVIFLLVSSAGVGALGHRSVFTDRGATEAVTWTEYRSIVVFRNDDIQPAYRTDAMRAVDDVFVREGVPVTQGVIPAIEGDRVDPNGELCRYLRTRARNHPETFEYALHGYTHEERTAFHGGSEFGGLPPDRQRQLIRDGTRALETCVDETPTTFVPPLDTYDNATARALVDEGYTVVSGGGWFTAGYYDETEPFEAHGLYHLPNSQSFVENWTTNEFHSQSSLERRFDAAHRDGGLYVQMLHYPTFTNESRLAVLEGLIDHMQSTDEVAFMTVGEFTNGSLTGRIERTEDGWRVLETTDDGSESPIPRVLDRVLHVGERDATRRLTNGRVDA